MIKLRNPHTGETRNVPSGFSWTTLFFGFFPALIRGDLSGAILQGLLALCTLGVSLLIMPFFYNGWHLKRLRNDGFRAVGVENKRPL